MLGTVSFAIPAAKRARTQLVQMPAQDFISSVDTMRNTVRHDAMGPGKTELLRSDKTREGWGWDKTMEQGSEVWLTRRLSCMTRGNPKLKGTAYDQLMRGEISVASSSTLGNMCGFGYGLRDATSWDTEPNTLVPYHGRMPGAWFDALYSLTELDPHFTEFHGNEFTEHGTRLEPAVLAEYARVMKPPCGVREGGGAWRQMCAEEPWFVWDSPDGWVPKQDDTEGTGMPARVVEFKAPFFGIHPKAPGLPDGLSPTYLVQCYVHMFATMTSECDFFALMFDKEDTPTDERTMCRIYWDDAVWAWIVARTRCYVSHLRVMCSGKYTNYKGGLQQLRRDWIRLEGTCHHTETPFPIGSVRLRGLP